MDLAEAWYSERCTSIMAGTYGGDEPNPAIVSVKRGRSVVSRPRAVVTVSSVSSTDD